MAPASRLRLLLLVAIAAMALFGACATTVPHQTIAPVEPTNDLPNPYQTIAPWGKLPEGRKWGALNGVAIDNDGESVWVADRCGANPDIRPEPRRSSTTAARVHHCRRSSSSIRPAIY